MFDFLGVWVKYSVCPCPCLVQVVCLSGLCLSPGYVRDWAMTVSMSRLCLCPGYVLSGLCLSRLCPSTKNIVCPKNKLFKRIFGQILFCSINTVGQSLNKSWAEKLLCPKDLSQKNLGSKNFRAEKKLVNKI